MSRAVKNLLVFFTLVCIIAVIVFAVELMLLNRDGADDSTAANTPPPGSMGAEDAGASPPTQTETPRGTESNPPGDPLSQDGESPTPSHSPDDDFYTLEMTDSVSLTIYVNDEMFDYLELDIAYLFTYKGGGTASLEILLDYLPQGAAHRAVGFLDNYTGGAEASIEDERNVGQSSVSGAFVTAISGETTYAAWICDIPGEADAYGITLIIHYEDENQKVALYEILDTIEIVPAEIDGDDDNADVDVD